jgi:hypothetical protein
VQIYSVRDSSLCLTGTAEIPLGGVAMDRILSEAQLPLKMAAFGRCFRTEAGAAGSGALSDGVPCQERWPAVLRCSGAANLHSFHALCMPLCSIGCPS